MVPIGLMDVHPRNFKDLLYRSYFSYVLVKKHISTTSCVLSNCITSRNPFLSKTKERVREKVHYHTSSDPVGDGSRLKLNAHLANCWIISSSLLFQVLIYIPASYKCRILYRRSLSENGSVTRNVLMLSGSSSNLELFKYFRSGTNCIRLAFYLPVK